MSRRDRLLEFNGNSKAKAEHRLRWHVSGADLIAVQSEHSYSGEVNHVHHATEAAQRKLWKAETKK